MVAVTSETLEARNVETRIAHAEASERKRELHVLQVFHGLGMGGAETWLLALLRYFHEQSEELRVNVKFDVLLTGGEKAIFDEEVVALGAKLFYVPFTRRNTLGFVREFRKLLATGNYDAIHDHQDYISGLHFLMGAGHLPPIRIAHVHNPLYHRTGQTNGPIRRVANSAGKQLLASLATHVMGTSRQIVTEYGFDNSSFRKVTLGAAHCGFDVTKYRGDRKRTHAKLCAELGWDDSAKIMLFVGRLEADEVFHEGRLMTHKNPALALEIAKECIASDEHVRLLMVGAGDAKRREFEARVQEWGLDQRIRFLGVRHDIPRLILGSDLLLFPSLAEGLGMVVVEAQAAGLRVLASDTTPRECVVIPELMEFLSLSANPARWADEALRLMNLASVDFFDYNAAVAQSAFSIESSAMKLLQLYGGN